MHTSHQKLLRRFTSRIKARKRFSSLESVAISEAILPNVGKICRRIQENDAIYSLSGATTLWQEVEISKKHFDQYWRRATQKRTYKTRYFLNLEGCDGWIDFIHGESRDTVRITVIFCTNADAEKFSPPRWFGTEVFND